MVVNIGKRETKTFTILDQHKLEILQKRSEITMLPSAIIAMGTAPGLAWEEQQLNKIEDMRLEMLNKDEEKWCKLIDEYEQQTGHAHRLAHGHQREEAFNTKTVAYHLLRLIKQGKLATAETPRFDFLESQSENHFVMSYNAKHNFDKTMLSQSRMGSQLGTWTAKPLIMKETGNFKISALERLLLESSTEKIMGYDWNKIKRLPTMDKELQSGTSIGGLYLTKWAKMKCPKVYIEDAGLERVISLQWEDKMNEIVKTKPRFMMMAKHEELKSNMNLQILATELSFYY